jgi:predicted permease
MSLRRFFRRSAWDEERARELDSYIHEEIADNVARGMTPGAARAAAYRKLGNPTLIREEIYTMNSIGFLETFWQDLRYGVRLLRRNPTFAIVAILTLALGTGANTAIFQLVDAVRLRTLPVERSHELVELRIDTHDKGLTGRFVSSRPFMTEPLLRRLQESQQAFSSLFGYGAVSLDLSTGGESRPIEGMWVTGNFFSSLGVQARIGRAFTAEDDRVGCAAPGAVLSDAFWKREFGGDPSVIGRDVRLDGRAFQIVGVMPPSFFGVEVGRGFDVALPLCAEPIVRGEQSGIGKNDVWFLDVLGRLKSGVTGEQASVQMATMSPELFRATLPGNFIPDDQRDYLANTMTLRPASTGVSSLRSEYATPLWVLLGATALVLLIACANLANLLLARATAREREIAVRLAIGASRRRIVRQMISESLVIALLGAAGGLVISSWLSRTLVSVLSTDSNRIFVDLRTDWRVFAFTLLVGIGATLLFGFAPALRATRTSIGATMKAGSRGMSDSGERFGLRRALVVAQVALSLVLLAGALLLGQTYRNLTSMDIGFRTEGGHDRRGRRAQAGRRAGSTSRDRPTDARAAPGDSGVDRAARTHIIPLSGMGWNNRVLVNGQAQALNTNLNQVSDDYFTVLSTPLVKGRLFDSRRDTPESEPVAIVNETFVRKFLPGQEPIGATYQVQSRSNAAPTYRVVGVVKDSKYDEIRAEFPPTAYLAMSQQKTSSTFPRFLVRGALPPAQLTAAVTAAIGQVNPGILISYRTLSAQIGDTLVSERLMAALSVCFGVLALVIATVGLYGVIAYMVARRRVEIGIRLALGAERRSVIAMIVREAVVLVAAGAVIGAGLAIAAGRSAATLLYGLEPWDPVTLASAIAILATVGALASWIPAWRASRLSRPLPCGRTERQGFAHSIRVSEQTPTAEKEPTEAEKRDNVIRLAFDNDPAKLERFVDAIKRVIPENTGVVLRGSAVTGYRWKDKAPFDADGPGTSDLDLTFVGHRILEYYKVTGFFVPGVHSRPISKDDPDIAPGLNPLRDELMAMVKRPVNIQGTRDFVMYFRGELLGQPYLTLVEKSDVE